MSNALQDRVSAIIAEHGLLTGQEFLDLTNNDMDLYWAYLDYWNALIIPEIHDKIEKRIEALE